MQKIFIGADHRGFAMKNQLVHWLGGKQYEVVDVGAEVYDEHDDYPEYALRVADGVRDENAFGIVLCGSGVGVCVAANKVDGVRCGQAVTVPQVVSARRDDDVRVLALGSDYVSLETAKQMIEMFLATPFAHEERFVRRLEQIKVIERKIDID